MGTLTYLTPYAVAPWRPDFDCGYEIHKGTVYTQGIIGNPTSGVSYGATLFSGLPPEMRPASSVPVTLYQFFFMTASTTSDTFPLSLASTVHPDGTWTLDSLPGDVASGANRGSVLLSGASWPVAGGARTDQLPAPESLTAYMAGTDFTNIDAAIGVHGNRVHLTGHVRCTADGALVIANGLPPKYWPAADPGDPSSESPGGFTPTGWPDEPNAVQALSPLSAPFGHDALQLFTGAPGVHPNPGQLLTYTNERVTPPAGWTGYWPVLHAGDVLDITGGWAALHPAFAIGQPDGGLIQRGN